MNNLTDQLRRLGAIPADETARGRISLYIAICMEASEYITSLEAENAVLKHDLERQMTIANAECHRAESLRAANKALVGVLRIFRNSAYPVCKTIDPRGHSWCEAYLDQALVIGNEALTQHGEQP